MPTHLLQQRNDEASDPSLEGGCDLQGFALQTSQCYPRKSRGTQLQGPWAYLESRRRINPVNSAQSISFEEFLPFCVWGAERVWNGSRRPIHLQNSSPEQLLPFRSIQCNWEHKYLISTSWSTLMDGFPYERRSVVPIGCLPDKALLIQGWILPKPVISDHQAHLAFQSCSSQAVHPSSLAIVAWGRPLANS